MSQTNKCPECGAELPASALRGLCPACLLKRGLETNTLAHTQPSSAGWAPPSIEELAGRFPDLEIQQLVGRGGMGAVYQARQKSLDRVVALKILPPEMGHDPAFAERFAREAQAMARLNHPHIVTIHEFGERQGLYYFIMEYVDGVSLRGLLDSGHVSTKEALAIVPQICEALQYAHDKGIVHRDIKPENILLSRQGQVKIADFGLAKLMGRTSPAAEKVMGTPHYMAPEQLDRPAEVDHRADIYALGVVFYQMLTGELPKGAFAPPSRKVQIDVRLDEIVLKALEKEPERRYQQASRIKTEVETIAGESAARQRDGNMPANAVSLGRRPLPAMLIPLGLHLAAIVLLLGFLILLLPGYERLFADLRDALPPITRFTVLVSRAMVYWGWPATLALLAADVGICLRLRSGSRALRWGWAALPPLGICIALGFGIWSLNLPLRPTTQQLQPAAPQYPQANHVGRNDASAYIVHDNANLHYLFFYAGKFSSSTGSSRNTQSLTWLDKGSLTLKKGGAFGYWRESVDPVRLSVNGHEFDLRRGRVLILHEDGTVAQLPLFPTLAEARDLDTLARTVTEYSNAAATGSRAAPTTDQSAVEGVGRSAGAVFLPLNTLIERTVYDDGVRKEFMIDFDTGRLFTPTKEQWDGRMNLGREAMTRLITAGGWDALCDTAGNRSGLYGFDMIAVPTANERWEKLTLEKVRDVLSMGRPGTPSLMSAAGKLPALYMFRTREGSLGVLQILELVEIAPKAIKIRYKLMEHGSATTPTTRAVATDQIAR